MTIFITGANRGIGAELVRQYAALAQDIIATTRGHIPDDLRALATWHVLDVTDQASFDVLMPVLDGLEISLLICNAGVYLDKNENLTNGYPAQQWHDTFAANVLGPFLSVQNLLPNLKSHGAAKIAIVASKMGSNAHADGGSYTYRASKAAAINVASNLATDLGPQGICVGAYHPGWVKTDMGSQNADIDALTAAAGLIQRFSALSLETNGCFQSFDGEILPF
ncbi:MAG: NAD(P)-dependent dehydrogenase (short-subunit alcohol dehydrogenase family) [Paracoccaceae bacterium]|jgi:NAD(P)-dependent dehydrogenase (short-subunit alcohol dehydrogenase family)